MGFQSFLNRRKKSKSRRNVLLERSPPPEPKPFDPQPVMTDRQSYVQELETVFRRFDVNGDGKITWSELGSIMSSLGQQVTPEELQRMVKQVDSDGDGCIDLGEFIELNTKGVDSGVVLEDLRNAFSIFDHDKNGSISCDELHRVLKNLGETTTMDECQRMINGVDCDGNGMIDFEEFKLMMMGSSWLRGVT